MFHLRYAVIGAAIALCACGDDPVVPPVIPPPEPVDTLTRWERVVAGGDHTCAVDASGRTFCWGLGTSGRLGTGTADSLAIRPAQVRGERLFFDLSAGAAHVCGIAAGGALHCWGLANYGQVGNRSSVPATEPFHVREHPFTFVAVDAGDYHTCAIGEDQRAHCWGLNADGQLGLNSTIGQGVPVRVAGEQRYAVLSAGGLHTCAVTTAGQAQCWGDGSSGQIGDGGTQDRLAPAAVSTTANYTVLSAGGRHTCGLTAAGQAFCWGAGSAGQLGNGQLTNSPVPVAVDTEVRFTDISAGEEHTCAVATTGRIYCWGHNNYGRLGRASLPAAQPRPAVVDSEVEFRSVSAGRLHTCAVARAGALYCWGFGGFGQLGTGFVLSRATPTRVAEPLR